MDSFLDFYRCPADEAAFGTLPGLSERDGYFRFGDAIAFGSIAGGQPAEHVSSPLRGVFGTTTMPGGRPLLPFDLSAVTTNLRQERYRQNGHSWLQTSPAGAAARRLYYSLRPFMGVGVRRHL